MNVVDASVAVKWFVTEPGHAEALSLLASEASLLAPDILLAEVANALRPKLRRGELSEVQSRDAVAALPSYLDGILPSAGLLMSAVDLALKLDHSVYDCLYLAAATAGSVALISADQVFVDKCRMAGLGRSVMSLQAWHEARHATALGDIAIREILDLHARFEKTLASVTDLVARPLGSGRFRITHSEDLKPAFDSPTYVGLRNAIVRLDRRTRSELLALGWLGQGYSGDDWSAILRRAEDYLTDDPETHIDYLISKISPIEAGLTRRGPKRIDPMPGTQDEA